MCLYVHAANKVDLNFLSIQFASVYSKDPRKQAVQYAKLCATFANDPLLNAAQFRVTFLAAPRYFVHVREPRLPALHNHDSLKLISYVL